ncbi:MBL fold metallo-hydrolase [Sphingopyxis sp.]|uniref:MBL fold metallo-hydrolase n=1 Tax=Sphingopyxis sp. TaxID=1908224 RepID=UPI001D73AE88|nr:MBL fold metallo-hydrolase [Sphingopyxis sp.]MBW8294476.1 MBL fold metallo-hydrolase [Sphingopyxis sp.]
MSGSAYPVALEQTISSEAIGMKPLEVLFHGAAGTVTGSCFEIRSESKVIIIDCGMFQGTRTLEALNHEKLPFDVSAVTAVILTHAHLDHSGRLPYLVASGCRAPIWTTEPTADIIEPLLLDSAKLQVADAERRNQRPDRLGFAPFVPLYTADDVATCLGQTREAMYRTWNDLGDGDGFRLWDARHIVGSASVELRLSGVRILFSGDIGGGSAIPCPSVELGGYDHIICESTYGNRHRAPVLISDRREQLAVHVEDVLKRGGNLLIPAFAVERTQVILEDLASLFEAKRLGSISVFVDSPLAERITRATLRHRHGGFDLIDHPNIRFVHDTAESKKLNSITGAVIIAGSGMCQGGRIRHHLLHNLPHPKARVLFVGFLAHGTLGAVLRDGAHHVRISGNDVPVRAEVKALESYSTHADRSALLEWLIARAPVSGSIFLVHGENESLSTLANDVRATTGFGAVIIPELGSAWELRPGRVAQNVGAPRADAKALIAPQDWVSGLADIESGLGDRLRALPSDAARERAVASIQRALERVEGQ